MTDPKDDYAAWLIHVGEVRADRLISEFDDELTARIDRRSAGHRNLVDEWASGWKLYEVVHDQMQLAATLLLARCELTKQNPDDRTPVREALTLIHFNACVIIQEILILLQAGLWAGAAARWRALHELTVTASLLCNGGRPIAERYMDHGMVVGTRRLQSSYSQYSQGPLAPAELATRIEEAQELCKRHELVSSPHKFHVPYGWALPLMPKDSSGRPVRPTFDKLEELADCAYWRELVGTAHGLVHADSAGVVAAVIAKGGGYILGGSPLFISTVARPTMLSTSRLAAATCIGFEPERGSATREILFAGATIMHAAKLAAEAFPKSESPDRLARGNRPEGYTGWADPAFS